MPSHQHRVKSLKQAAVRQERNTQVKSRVKTMSKKVSPESQDLEKDLRSAISTVAKASQLGVIHRKAASRRISRLTKRANKIQAEKA